MAAAPELPRSRDVPQHRPRRALYGAGNPVRRLRSADPGAVRDQRRRRPRGAASHSRRQHPARVRRDGRRRAAAGGCGRERGLFPRRQRARRRQVLRIDRHPRRHTGRRCDQSAASAPAAARADRVPHAARDAKADARPRRSPDRHAGRRDLGRLRRDRSAAPSHQQRWRGRWSSVEERAPSVRARADRRLRSRRFHRCRPEAAVAAAGRAEPDQGERDRMDRAFAVRLHGIQLHLRLQ